jgi:hypothetical protein
MGVTVREGSEKSTEVGQYRFSPHGRLASGDLPIHGVRLIKVCGSLGIATVESIGPRRDHFPRTLHGEDSERPAIPNLDPVR